MMHPRMARPYGLLLMVLLMPSITIGSQNVSKETGMEVWETCSICGIQARVALNSSPGFAIVPRRHIYLFIQESDFTRENLAEAFQKLSAAYPDPILLGITAYSNAAYLKQLIRAAEATGIIDFADTPAGRQAEKEYYSDRYPPETGYFRADYFRRGSDEESFQYTPSKTEAKTVSVILKKKAPGR